MLRRKNKQYVFSITEICNLPKETGPCKAAMKRFYWDSKRNKCSQFIYGGCGGNENRFESRKECRKTCK